MRLRSRNGTGESTEFRSKARSGNCGETTASLISGPPSTYRQPDHLDVTWQVPCQFVFHVTEIQLCFHLDFHRRECPVSLSVHGELRRTYALSVQPIPFELCEPILGASYSQTPALIKCISIFAKWLASQLRSMQMCDPTHNAEFEFESIP